MVRPERLELCLSPPDGGTSIEVQVIKRVFSGDTMTFTVRAARGLELVCQKPSLASFRGVETGARVWVRPQDCRALPREA
jgi:hypothetical protein